MVVCQVTRLANEPPHIVDRNIGSKVRRSLALVAELHDAVAHASDEICVLTRERLGVPAAPLQYVISPGAERGTPVDDQVASLERVGFCPAFENCRIRPTCDV